MRPEPALPNRSDMAPDGPNQAVWVADITWPGHVGYAISRSIDARLTIAALDAAVRSRAPPAGCVHHSDRGSQPVFKRSSQHRLCSFITAARSSASAGVLQPSVFLGRALR